MATPVVIVSFMVTATSGLPGLEAGLATGAATISQQSGITVGIPVMSAVVAAGLAGTVAIWVNWGFAWLQQRLRPCS